MMNAFASPIGFIALLSFFAIGAVGAFLVRKNDEIANIWSSFFAIVGSLWGIFFSFVAFRLGHTLTFSSASSPFPLLSLSFHIDTLSFFFIFVISLIVLFCSIYGVGYVRQYYGKYSIGALGFFYHLFVAGMFLVVTSANALFFLIAWEVMSVASYFLVVYDRNDANNVRAGFLYLVMTHIGTALILLAFLFFYRFAGSFDFAVIKTNGALIPLFAKNSIFILAMIGFGTKSGIIPFHIWLPVAHPAAPSHVSALMSGVMIKTGIYMMIRIFLDMLQPVPAWWGLAILIIGAVSALLGVLYAITESDIKRLLAYSSIENIGIILLGLGSTLTFLSLDMPALAFLGFVAALFHMMNHAIFKSLLFLGAGSVIHQTHTRNMEEYGGLITYMPHTALFFLIGSMAISALPPFNGFFSEWMTLQSLFQGIASLDAYPKWIFMVSAGALAFTGGLALACFVKAFGATFLARPRSQKVAHAKESSAALLLGMGSLAILSVFFGVCSGYVSRVFIMIARGLTVFGGASSFISVSIDQRIVLGNIFSSVSAPVILVSFIVAIAIVGFVVNYLVYQKQKQSIGATWDCGTDLQPRMEITAAGFSRSLVMIFHGILRPSVQHDIEYHDADTRYVPKSRTIIFGINDVYQRYLYAPANTVLTLFSNSAKKIQSGVINTYILYIFIALMVVLFSVAR